MFLDDLLGISFDSFGPVTQGDPDGVRLRFAVAPSEHLAQKGVEPSAVCLGQLRALPNKLAPFFSFVLQMKFADLLRNLPQGLGGLLDDLGRPF